MAGNVRIIDNSDQIKSALDQAIDKGLEMIGLKAEGYAKKKCPVDTGLLRNSITHAQSGQSFSHSYSSTDGKQSGTFSGAIGSDGDKAEYIGTNVEYAAYVEMGTSRTAAQPYLKPAATEHMDEYERILKACVKEAIDD